jgi:dCMP deaminase
MYVVLFPCNECAKLIIQGGISEIVYLSDKYHDHWQTVASRRLLQAAGVRFRQFIPPMETLTIDFKALL